MHNKGLGVVSSRNAQNRYHPNKVKARRLMSDLKSILDELTKFGVTPNVEGGNNLNTLKLLLANIYSHYLEVSFEYDENDYDESPDFDYKVVRKIAESNFPELGFYHSLFESHQVSREADVTLGDGIDDLTDIIKDMLAVKWRFENTSNNDAL
jgi:hypothetical protein